MIKEIIVVEGRDDEVAVKRALDCDTIASGGLYYTKVFIEELKTAQKERGIIIFTDPDYAGEKIRKRINKEIPGAKNAFLDQRYAKKDGDIGVENAAPFAIEEAILAAKPEEMEKTETFSMADLVQLGLMGSGSKDRRIALGKKFHIGYGNGKQFLKKLNSYNISREDLVKAVEELDER